MQHTYTREEVVLSLETVLHDAKFAAAPQMSAFLRFVVIQTLDGNSDRIKAYTVAVDALGKPPTFDPQNDPSVRVLAKRLRDTLTAYYQRTSEHQLVILLKSGSYIPSFVSVEAAQIPSKPSNITPLNSAISESFESSANHNDKADVETSSMESDFSVVQKLAKP